MKILSVFCCARGGPEDDYVSDKGSLTNAEDLGDTGRGFSNAASRASNESARGRTSTDRANSGALFDRKFISPFHRADQSIKYSAQTARSVSGELPTPEQVEDFYALYGRLTRLEKKLESRRRPPLVRPPKTTDISMFAQDAVQNQKPSIGNDL